MKLNQAVAELREEMIRDIIELVKIPSVIDEHCDEKPFGLEIDNALKCALKQAENLGFKTYYDPKGYYGYAEIGEGETLIGILGHLDVVPEGDASHWTYPPFEGKLDKNKLYGRGVQDDKGPMVAVMYAIRALVLYGVEFNKRVRIIFGTDEENQWRGISMYIKEQEIPSYGFTPDSSFPVIFAEKGLLQVRLKSKTASPVNVKAGTALNAVPESALIKCDGIYNVERNLKKLGFDYENDGEEILVIGKSSHASKPHLGINAINRLMMALKESNFSSCGIDFLTDRIGLTHFGELIFGDCSDEPSGKLTINVGKVDFSRHGEEIGIDIRIPVTISKKFIENGIKRVCEKYDLEYEEFDYLPPIYLENEHPMISRLSKVYVEETGLDGTPISTGGATYARAMKNCVAFGPIFPGQAKTEHQVDECIEIELLVKAAQIYAKAIKSLLEI